MRYISFRVISIAANFVWTQKFKAGAGSGLENRSDWQSFTLNSALDDLWSEEILRRMKQF